MAKINLSPAQVDDCELWQLAALFDQQKARPQTPEEVNAELIRRRHEAAAQGRELDPDEVFAGMSDGAVSRIMGMQSPA